MSKIEIGNFSTVNWRRCFGYACLGWLILYSGGFIIGGIIDYYRPDWLVWLYGG